MKQLRLNGRVWFEMTAGNGNTERFMGIGCLQLLGHIQQVGSINQAAKAMQMSYKRAWDLVQSMNRLAGTPLVATQTGGGNGGGAVVTPTGETYLMAYQAAQVRFQEFLADELAKLPVLG